MFGMPQRGAAPAGKSWNEMFFHQKVQHLVDHGADWIVDKSGWWVPCVGATMAVCIVIFGGENGIGELIGATQPLFPICPQTTLGIAPPQRGGGGGEHEDMEEDMEDF